MLNYPSDFETPAFPAGGRIARTRVFGIGIMTAFFLIACVCGLLVWGAHSVRRAPFLISIDAVSGSWTVINRSVARHPHISVTQTVQESVAANFFRNWFFISDIMDVNVDAWRACERENCTGAEIISYGGGRCALSCGAGEDLYTRFTDDVMPVYKLRADAGETWNVMVDTVRISDVNYTDAGGTWIVRGSVWSKISDRFDVIAFVRIGRDVARFPMTLGYYVTDFNAYRVLR